MRPSSPHVPERAFEQRVQEQPAFGQPAFGQRASEQPALELEPESASELALPLVGVTTRYVEGANSVDDPGLELCKVLPLDEALAGCWDVDAHLMPYQLVLQPSSQPQQGGLQPPTQQPGLRRTFESWPRLNKPTLEGMRQRGADAEVTILVLDWDTPNHAPIDGELRDAMEGALVRAADAGLSLALSWTFAYVTRGGFRLIYVLSRPTPPEEFEPLYLGVCRDFLAYGIKLDEQCHPWNWTFRLPRVTREPSPLSRVTREPSPLSRETRESSHSPAANGLGLPSERTWLAPYFEFFEQPANRLDPSSVIPAEHRLLRAFSGANGLVSTPPPSPETCKTLIEQVGKTGRMVQTEWQREARSRMRGRSCFSALFEGAPLASKSTRHTRIQEVAGELAAMLCSSPGASPETLFALMDDALARLREADPRDPEDWRDSAWKAVNKYLAAERERLAVEAKEQQEAQVQVAQAQGTLFDRVLEGVRSWCDSPEIHKSDEAASRWISGRVVACWKNDCFVLGPTGYYDPIPIKPNLLAARIRELGMDLLVPLQTEANGKIVTRSGQDILNQHASVIAQCEGAINLPGALLKHTTLSKPTLMLPMYSRRTDLEPRFDAEVDTWLQLFGGVEYPRLCAWIGHALSFEDGPICALSIKGPPGAGKKLLYVGLSECLETPRFATGAEFGRYNGFLMQTPFLVVNEGLPRMSQGDQHPADTFRAYVSGDPIRVRELFTPPVIVRNPVRVMFLANNLDVVQELIGGRDLSPDDRDAIAIRLLHIVAGDATPGWLRSRGGLRFTQGWIQGDSGQPSNYRIARHFLWLWLHRPAVPDGNRLLVEGNADSELIRQMTTRSGSAPIVIEALLRMVESETVLQGIVIEGSSIFVTSKGVTDFFRSQMATGMGNKTLNVNTVSTVLKGLLVPGSDTAMRSMRTTQGPLKARWKEVDASVLLQEAIEHGYVARKLEHLALGQRELREHSRETAAEIQRAYGYGTEAPSPQPGSQLGAQLYFRN